MSTKKRIAQFGIKYYPSKGGTSRLAEALLYRGTHGLAHALGQVAHHLFVIEHPQGYLYIGDLYVMLYLSRLFFLGESRCI